MQPRSQCPLLPVPAGQGRIPLGRIGEDSGNEVGMHTHVVRANKDIEW